MICRSLAPLVVVAFLTAHIAACTCRFSRAGPKSPEKQSHSCCNDAKQAPTEEPEHKSCCCSDGSHLAIAEHTGEAANESAIPDAVFDSRHALSTDGAERTFHFSGSPPGRAPGVPLFTLHSALLI